MSSVSVSVTPHRAAALLAAVVSSTLATPSFAQPRVVSPAAFADMEAPDVADVTAVPSYRLQQIHDASDFASLGPGPHLLTRVDWRADGGITSPLVYPSPDWRLSLSTTSVAPGNLSATLADNLGPDEQVVLSGPVTLQTNADGPAGGPKAFDYGVDLDVPFAHDPSLGNLLMDLTVRDGSGPLLLDSTGPLADTTSFFWTGSLGVDSPVAEAGQFGGHIAQFSFVPEPSSGLLLLVVAAAALPAYGRKRSSRG